MACLGAYRCGRRYNKHCHPQAASCTLTADCSDCQDVAATSGILLAAGTPYYDAACSSDSVMPRGTLSQCDAVTLTGSRTMSACGQKVCFAEVQKGGQSFWVANNMCGSATPLLSFGSPGSPPCECVGVPDNTVCTGGVCQGGQCVGSPNCSTVSKFCLYCGPNGYPLTCVADGGTKCKVRQYEQQPDSLAIPNHAPCRLQAQLAAGRPQLLLNSKVDFNPAP